MRNETIVHICTSNRVGEIGFLLQSLLQQKYKKFDILLLDDGSNHPITSTYYINLFIYQLKEAGHNVKIIRNNQPSGVWQARQQLVDYTLENLKHKYICRLDDDIILSPDYLEKLKDGIDNGYDLMSGLTVPIGPVPVRDIKYVEPIIGYCELDDKGELTYNGDDCGYLYNEEKILLSPHFRSCAMYKTEIHTKGGIDYKCRLSKHGFREEQLFSFKMVIKGYKLGVHTGAINFHLNTPSGGERSTVNKTELNQKVFEESVKRMYDKHGDFLSKYYTMYGIEPRKLEKDEYLKVTNLVSKK